MDVQTYNNPGGIIAGTVITEGIAVLCVGLRFYARYSKKQSYITSDWLILVALIMGAGLAFIEIYGVAHRVLAYPIGGSFADPIVSQHLSLAKKLQVAIFIFGVVGAGFVKLSVCFLYWHLFSKVVFRRLLIVWTTIVVVWLVGAVLGFFFQCGTHFTAPLGSPDEYARYCTHTAAIGYAVVASNMATDLLTVLIPIPVIMGMHMSRKKKILTLLTFMIGSLSVGASIAKAYIYIIATTGQYTEDAMLLLTGLSIWNLLEVQVGILAACGPTIRQVVAETITNPCIRGLKSLASLFGFNTCISWKSSSSSSSSSSPGAAKYEPDGELGLPSYVKQIHEGVHVVLDVVEEEETGGK